MGKLLLMEAVFLFVLDFGWGIVGLANGRCGIGQIIG